MSTTHQEKLSAEDTLEYFVSKLPKDFYTTKCINFAGVSTDKVRHLQWFHFDGYFDPRQWEWVQPRKFRKVIQYIPREPVYTIPNLPKFRYPTEEYAIPTMADLGETIYPKKFETVIEGYTMNVVNDKYNDIMDMFHNLPSS